MSSDQPGIKKKTALILCVCVCVCVRVRVLLYEFHVEYKCVKHVCCGPLYALFVN